MNDSSTDEISHLFKGIWSLENFDTDKEVAQIIEKAIQNPHNYVMKPQKEGGGNNFFDDEIARLLNEMVQKPDQVGEMRTYLIMERINPPKIKQIQMRNGETKILDCISELGIFSSIFVKNDSTCCKQKVLKN